ncbi:unnamed protein product [Prunus armeniaca]|uniref:Uncharacterized protein n=1 Tax=Prunus armeniaca TaxID=36596 RepID=A0A6J5UCU1_PRUAR|nr:unnamed protein product [Prunus armeniaca]
MFVFYSQGRGWHMRQRRKKIFREKFPGVVGLEQPQVPNDFLVMELSRSWVIPDSSSPPWAYPKTPSLCNYLDGNEDEN